MLAYQNIAVPKAMAIITPMVMARNALSMIAVEEEGKRWIVYRVIVEVDRPDVTLDWENTEQAWIDPAGIGCYDVVPIVALTARGLS